MFKNCAVFFAREDNEDEKEQGITHSYMSNESCKEWSLKSVIEVCPGESVPSVQN